MKKNPLLFISAIYVIAIVLIGYWYQNTEEEVNLIENNKVANNYQNELAIYTFNIKNVYNIQYDMMLYFGEKHNPFRILLDTGSSVLWVASPNCESCARAGMINPYDCATSSTCKEFPTSTRVLKYGIGEVEGFSTMDKVSLYPNEGKLFVENQEFIQIKRIDEIKRLRADGIIGIAPRDDNDPDTLFDNLKKQGKIKKIVFSLYLTGRSCKDDSLLIIGGYNSSLLAGELNYSPVIKRNSWTLKLDKAEIKDKNNNTFEMKTRSKNILIDSGTTSIGLGSHDTQSLIDLLNSQPFYLDCKSKSTFQGIFQIQCGETDLSKYPRLVFVINKVEYDIGPDDYVQYCQSIQNFFLKTECYLSFILDKSLDLEKLIVLGDTFMVKYYCVFDMEEKKIGIGLAKKPEEKISIKSQAIEQLMSLAYILLPMFLILFIIFQFFVRFGHFILKHTTFLNKYGTIYPFVVLDSDYDLNEKIEVEMTQTRILGEQLVEETNINQQDNRDD